MDHTECEQMVEQPQDMRSGASLPLSLSIHRSLVSIPPLIDAVSWTPWIILALITQEGHPSCWSRAKEINSSLWTDFITMFNKFLLIYYS